MNIQVDVPIRFLENDGFFGENPNNKEYYIGVYFGVLLLMRPQAT